MNNIYCYKLLFDYLTNIFCRNGKPLPGNYVTADKTFSDKYIYHTQNGDIHDKKILKHFSGKYFFPETFFSREKFTSKEKESMFFLKDSSNDNGEGLKLLTHENIPPIIPINKIVQPVINSLLYNKRKFDIRVLVCVRRDGYIMIYKNLLYQINPNIFHDHKSNSTDVSLFITNRQYHGDSSLSFFHKTHPGEFDTEHYLSQLKEIIPIIFDILLKIANVGYPESYENSFIFGGLDFLPKKIDNKLLFLELNVTPGWGKALGIDNYQEFYKLATDFILGKEKNLEECIYISP